MAHGKVFHSFDAEHVNDLLKSVVLDLGTASEPFSEDLNWRVQVCETGLSRSDIYGGVSWFKAL